MRRSFDPRARNKRQQARRIASMPPSQRTEEQRAILAKAYQLGAVVDKAFTPSRAS